MGKLVGGALPWVRWPGAEASGVPVGAGLRCPGGVMEVSDRICRGRPMCRPVSRSRKKACRGGHIGPPLRGVEGVPNQRELAQDESLPQWGGTEPAPYRGPEQADASRPAAHSGASAARSRGMGGNRSRDHPQSAQQHRAIPQSRLRRASSLYTREPWGRGMRIAASALRASSQ